jgi:regulator of PEP synthase PpsR (kinase-PPPase family)
LERIALELRIAEHLMRRRRRPVVDVSYLSVEETAAEAMRLVGL